MSGGGIKAGQHLGAVRMLDDLRGRCVIDEECGCWHFRGARGQVMRRDRTPQVFVHLIGKIPVTRASWCLSGREMPPSGRLVYRVCESYDCANPEHLRSGTRRQQGRHLASSGKAWTAAKAAANAVMARARRIVTPELAEWIAESPQGAREVAHAVGVHHNHVNVIRRKAREAPIVNTVFAWRPGAAVLAAVTAKLDSRASTRKAA